MIAIIVTRNTTQIYTKGYLRAVGECPQELNMHNHGLNVNVIITGMYNVNIRPDFPQIKVLIVFNLRQCIRSRAFWSDDAMVDVRL
jgi:hypothetical protein